MFTVRIFKRKSTSNNENTFFYHYYRCKNISLTICNYKSQDMFDAISGDLDLTLCEQEPAPKRNEIRRLYLLSFDNYKGSTDKKGYVAFQNCEIQIWRGRLLWDNFLCSDSGMTDLKTSKKLTI